MPLWKPFRINVLGARTIRPLRQVTLLRRTLALALSILLGAVVALAPASAAPITGENQAAPAAEAAPELDVPALQDPAALSAEPTFSGDADATVIEFSIVPSTSDPSKVETVIIVLQQGGKTICANQSTSDVISRGYLSRGDAPFDPQVPGEIRGLASGDAGELVGFNDTKVFIKPHTPEDEFSDPDECFQVAEVEACFVPDGEDCDQMLQEGDAVCVGDSISSTGCPVTAHGDLMRRLRIMVALNQPPGEAPIITAADLAGAPELAPPSGEPGEPGGLPAGPGPAGPTAEPPSGSGGGALIPVPNVVGLTLEQASTAITTVGLTVGNVTTQGQASYPFPTVIRSAHAAPAPPVVLSQTPPAFTLCLPFCPVSLVLSAAEADIPEPSALALFALGLGLLILLTWRHRRRSG